MRWRRGILMVAAFCTFAWWGLLLLVWLAGCPRPYFSSLVPGFFAPIPIWLAGLALGWLIARAIGKPSRTR